MILGISSYLTSAGLNSVVSAGALGPSFSPKYFLPIYSPTWDKAVRTGQAGSFTSALSISSLNLTSATDAGLNLMGVEKIFNNVPYSVSDKVFVYSLNGIGSSGNNTFVSNQNVASDVNLLNGKPVSNGISATSISAINSNTLTVTGRYDYPSSGINDYLNYNPLSATNLPLSAFFRVASYSPKVEEQNTVGRFKCRIPASDSTFKFNGIALYITKTDLNGFDDNGAGISFFNFKPVLFAIILFDRAQYKQALVGGINDYEISVDLGFNYDSIPSTSAGNPVYVETNYWTKMPTSTTTSAYGINYDGDVVISSSAIAESWTPRAKLTITDNKKEQLRLSHTNDRFTDFRTEQIPYNGDSSFGPLNSDRTVLSVDTCGEWDSLLQLGTDTSAYGIKSIALGCKTSAGGYDSASTNSVDGGYTLATGVETLAKGFASVTFGLKTSAIGNMNLAGGYKSKAQDLDSSQYQGEGTENDGYNFAYGKEVSAISTTNPSSGPYDIFGSSTIYGYNFAFGQKTLSNGGASYSRGFYTSSTGLLTHSEGAYNLATNALSYSFGAYNYSTEAFSHTDGYKNSATNKFSYAIGNENLSTGVFSYTFGQLNSATGDFSLAHGQRNNSTGNNSVAIGYENISNGLTSISMGFRNNSTGNNSLAIGDNNTSNAKNGIAIGTRTSATGVESISIGVDNLASGNKSFSLGYITSAIGTKSFAIGTKAVSNSEDSLAIGPYSIATGNRSLSLGYFAETTKDDQIVIGSCKTDVGIYGKNIEIVGKKCELTDKTKIRIAADEVEIEGYSVASTVDSFYVWINRGNYQIDITIMRKRFNNGTKFLDKSVATKQYFYNGTQYYSENKNISMILFNPSTMEFKAINKADRPTTSSQVYGQEDKLWVDTTYPGYIILAANNRNASPIISNGQDITNIMNTRDVYYYSFNNCVLFSINVGSSDRHDIINMNGIKNSEQDNTGMCVYKGYVQTSLGQPDSSIKIIDRYTNEKIYNTVGDDIVRNEFEIYSFINKITSYSSYSLYKQTTNVSVVDFFKDIEKY